MKRVVSVIVAVILLISLVSQGSGSDVFAASGKGDKYFFAVDPYSIMGKGDNANYPIEFSEECFDSKGNVTIEFVDKSFDSNEYYECVPAEHKILISKKYFTNLYDSINKHLNEKGEPNRYSDVYYQAMGVLGPRKIFSIAGTLQKFGESITMNKSDFNKSGRFTTPAICLITSDFRSEWVDGYWFDANGLNSYKPLASWKGSGSQCWYEDTEGWYPTNQWQKINYSWYYFDENGYAAYNGYFNANGTWYYFGEDYKYEHVYGGSWRDGYFLNEDGTQTYAPKAEWKSDSKGWWYEDASGWYATGVTIIDGEDYYFTSDGYMACNGWYELGDDNGHYNTSWNHYDASGVRDGWGFYDESGEWVEEFFR